MYGQVLDAYLENRKCGGTRADYLARVAEIEGMYVPSFYETAYREDGTIASFVPVHPAAKPVIRKQVEMSLSDTFYPEKPIVPFLRPIQDRVVLEIQRGCIRGCRFCQAGMLYRPIRARGSACAAIRPPARRSGCSCGYPVPCSSHPAQIYAVPVGRDEHGGGISGKAADCQRAPEGASERA